MQADNIFHLVHRFGTLEDQISANFGFILKMNPPVLHSFLHRLRIPSSALTDLTVVEVETQVSYTGDENEHSRIDLQIRLPGQLIVFVESKLENTPLGRDQLGKYALILGRERERHEHVRLVLVTQFDRLPEAEKWRRILQTRAGLSRGEFASLRWEQIRQMVVDQADTGKTRFLNQLFLKYVGDMMSDKKLIADQVIRKVPEVMIAATDPDFWSLALRRRVAVQSNNTPDARYVAFYRINPERAITHIAEVEYTERNVMPRAIYNGFPRLLRRERAKSRIDKPLKVYRLKELTELAFPIRKRRHGAAYRVKAFKTMTQLLQARYLDDLFRSQKGRASRGLE